MKTIIENDNRVGNTNGDPQENHENEEKKEFKINGRNFMLTINDKVMEHEKEIIKYFQKYKAFQYMLICEHDKPQIHHHMYVQLNQARVINSKYLYGAHIENCYGSAQQNVNYLRALDEKHIRKGIKSKDIYEFGTLKERGGRRIKDILKMNDEDVMNMDINQMNAIFKIKGIPKTKIEDWHKDVKIYYVWGPSGIGKSLYAKELVKEHGYDEFTELKHIGNFWNCGGIEITGAAIYDDFRDNHMTASEFINFIDYNVHSMNFKGGYTKNKLNLIIITSIQSPNEIYKTCQGEPRNQWMRRMEIIDMNEKNINKFFKCTNEITI